MSELVWWTEHYGPLESRIRELREEYRDDPEALEMLKKHQNEIDMVERNPEDYRSIFFILEEKAHTDVLPS